MMKPWPPIFWVLNEYPDIPMPVLDKERLLRFADKALAFINRDKQVIEGDAYFVARYGDFIIASDNSPTFWTLHAREGTAQWPDWIRIHKFADLGLGPSYTEVMIEVVEPYLRSLLRLLG